MSRNSYNNPDFKPFQSGNSLCHPSTDYSAFKGGKKIKGGNKTLIKTTPGKNLYKEVNYSVDKSSLKSLIGKSYSTSAGGSKTKKGGNLSGAPVKDDKSLGDSVAAHGLCGPAPVPKKGGKRRQYKKRGGKLSGAPLVQGTNDVELTLEEVVPESLMSGGKKKKVTKKKVTKKKGGFYDNHIIPEPNNDAKLPQEEATAEESMIGGKKKKVTKKKPTKKPRKKSMKGGKESEGATGMPVQFYSGKSTKSYSSNNGKGVSTSFGVIDPKDAGVGNLAPYNTAKTGGKRNVKGGGKLRKIPGMSDAPMRAVDKIVNFGAKKLKTFLEGVEKNYEKSLVKINQTKNGLNRLSTGGSKKRKQVKKSKKSLKGGDGSDFAATLNSRGPANAPDNYMGVDGEKFFRQFNKTGTYIPNSKLSKAAAPKLTGSDKVNTVTGFSSFESTSAPLEGGKKKVKTTKSKKKAVKKVNKKKGKKC